MNIACVNKFKGKIVHVYAQRHVEAELHPILISTLDGGK
jgi:hypothetical protein